MRYVTQDDIKKINELYIQLKTYAAVSRATGFAPSTVKKYVINGYQIIDETKIKRFDRPLPEFDIKPFLIKDWDWNPLCSLSDEEISEIKELWEELEI